MAFEDPAEEELDYDNDDAMDPCLPGHPVLEEEDLDDDEDYEDLYGDVNVGMYSAPSPPPPPTAAAASAAVDAHQNGDLDSVEEDDNGGADDLKVDGVVPPLQEESVEYDEEIPDVKEEETLPDDLEVGPSSKKPKESSGQGVVKDSAPKGGKSVGGVNGGGGDGGGGGRSGWPAGSGPAGGQAGNAAAVANNTNLNTNANTNNFAAFPGKPGSEGGSLMLFVGELHWWTTDAELEASLSEYGRIKNLKFFEEKASGKSKGYCQVEFFDSGAARVCKEKMDGRVFNGRACVVAFASPQTIKQMGAAQVGKNQAHAQGQGQTKKSADGRNNGGGGQGGGGGGGEPRGFSKGGRGQQAGMERGRGNSSSTSGQAPGGRGRGGRGPPGGGGMMPMGGPPGAMMPPRGMMGPGGGFEPGFGPPGGGYGMGPGGSAFGPRGPMFGPPFPPMGPGLPGVPAHVNPAFFGRGNGPGPGMEGPPGGWGEVGMPSWEEHQRHMREGGYAGPEDMGGGDFGYGGGEMGRVGPARERDRGAGEAEWGSERRRRDDRSGERGEDWERGDRHRGSEREGGHRERERGEHRDKEKDWERGERPGSRAPRDKDDERARSREDDHGKRRRMSGDRDRKADR